MNQFFSSSTKWCDSKHPYVQRLCKIVSSEEVKQFASMFVIIYIVYRILDALRHPVMRVYRWMRKKTTQLMKAKGPIPKVPQPCVLRLDNNKVDIDKWVNQARMYVEPLEENRRVEMLLMLVDQNERTSLESHCLVDRPLSSEEHVEYLLKVITEMYKKKETGDVYQEGDRRCISRRRQEMYFKEETGDVYQGGDRRCISRRRQEIYIKEETRDVYQGGDRRCIPRRRKEM